MSEKKKFRKLTDFANKSKGSTESQTSSKREGTIHVRSEESGVDKESGNAVSELVNVLMQRFKTSETRDKATSSTSADKSIGKEERKDGKEVLTGKLSELIKTAISRAEIKVIECNQQGVCSDGRRIGEVFEDDKGIKWQRGFLNTTRLPIFLDFIAEDAVIKGRIGRAYIIETSRGTEAIVPEDFICEMTSRYGVLINNMDKCVNYRSSPWVERSSRKTKVKKQVI